ncbi:MAG: sulfatase [Opitutaceae bacterium]
MKSIVPAPVVRRVVAAIALAASVRATTPARPNILWIMSDDHAAEAIGAYGGILAKLDPTPTLDRLARDGARFTNVFCTNSICTPSRATLLTGQYSHVHGVKTLDGRIPAAQQTLPRLIGAVGYQTAMIGKWHLGEEPAAFDYYCVLPGQGWYFNPVFQRKGRGPWPKNEFRFEGYDSVHVDDAVTRLSIEWLKQRDRSRPFFLMHHFKSPHDNFENAERYDFLYEHDTIPEPASLHAVPNAGSAATTGQGTSVGKRNTRRNMGDHMFVDRSLPDDVYQRTAYQRYLKKYLRCVRGVDDSIARLLEHLKTSGDLEDTIILYTSDQGFMLGQHDYIDKRWMYEPSLRMPFIVHYPRGVRPGTVSDALINNTDFAPTLLDLAGVSAPADMPGRSFRAMLEGRPVPADWRTATYYRYWMHLAHHDNPAHYGLRTADYKLIFFYGLPLDARGALPTPTTPGWELYDLRRDPEETKNVYADPAHAATVRQLKAELLRVKQEIGDTDEKYPELMQVRAKHWN